VGAGTSPFKKKRASSKGLSVSFMLGKERTRRRSSWVPSLLQRRKKGQDKEVRGASLVADRKPGRPREGKKKTKERRRNI